MLYHRKSFDFCLSKSLLHILEFTTIICRIKFIINGRIKIKIIENNHYREQKNNKGLNQRPLSLVPDAMVSCLELQFTTIYGISEKNLPIIFGLEICVFYLKNVGKQSFFVMIMAFSNCQYKFRKFGKYILYLENL